MHELTGVIVPMGTTLDEAHPLVEAALAPFSEMESEDGWWDWWAIGGRWTGLYSEYDPNQDPANREVCRLCNGSGTRRDVVVANGCNGCAGKGTHVSWPTHWLPVPEDVVPVKVLLNNPTLMRPMHVVTPDGRDHHKERWDGGHFVDTDGDHDRALEDWPDMALVVVDIHT